MQTANERLLREQQINITKSFKSLNDELNKRKSIPLLENFEIFNKELFPLEAHLLDVAE